MRVLVTGGAGFVGRALCRKLWERGDSVTLVDDLSSGQPPHLWAPLDVEYEFLHMDARRLFAGNTQWQFDLIFHCAAVVGGRLTIDGDPLRVATDLSIDSEFFNWLCRLKHKPKRVVYFSSSAVYPIAMQRRGQRVNLSETFIDFRGSRLGMPDQTYGMSKFVGEYLAQFAAKNYNIPVVCYRPFSGYSEDQSLDYPFPSIIKRVLGSENPITVWGSGEQERDFIHIDDCVDGVLATMMALQPGEALNLGTGRATTFTELAKMAGRVFGRAIEVKNDPTKPEGVFSRVADTAKMRRWFEPKITLEEGVLRAVKALDNLIPVS